MNQHLSLRIIREEHHSLAAMLQSLMHMVRHAPSSEDAEASRIFFDVVRAMLFYIDEFPERLHHPKESHLLFPRVALAAPHARTVIDRLERDHAQGEARVRELMHMLLAWELLGESRRQTFVDEVTDYVNFCLEHMRLEDTLILPEAERRLGEADWRALDEAFAENVDPLNPRAARDPLYDRLYTRIVMTAPAPIGLG
jgi:hemerythrin-like domain-containing protein